MKCETFFISRLLSLLIIAQPLVYSVSVHAMDASPAHYAHTTRPSQIGAIKQKIIGAYNTTKQWMLDHKLFLSGIGTAIIGYCGYQWLLAPTPPMAPSPIVPDNQSNQPIKPIHVHDQEGDAIIPIAGSNNLSDQQADKTELQNIHENLLHYRTELRNVRSHIAAYVMSDYQRQDIIELFHHNAPQLPCGWHWFINPFDRRIFIKKHFEDFTQWNYVNSKPYFTPGMTHKIDYMAFHNNGSYVVRNEQGTYIRDKNNTLLFSLKKNVEPYQYCIEVEEINNSNDEWDHNDAKWDDSGNHCAVIAHAIHRDSSRSTQVTVLIENRKKFYFSYSTRPRTWQLSPSFSPDGKHIAYYDWKNSSVVIINCKTQTQRSIPVYAGIVTFLDWHTNDTLILMHHVLNDDMVQEFTLLNTDCSHDNKRRTKKEFAVKNLQQSILSPDRKKIALITKNKLSLLNLETDTASILSNNKNHRALIVAQWSLDNSLLAICQESALQIWDASTSRLKYEFVIKNPNIKNPYQDIHYKLFWTTDNKLAYGLNTSYSPIDTSASIRLLDIPALDRLMDAFDKKNKNPIKLNAILYAKLQQKNHMNKTTTPTVTK